MDVQRSLAVSTGSPHLLLIVDFLEKYHLLQSTTSSNKLSKAINLNFNTKTKPSFISISFVKRNIPQLRHIAFKKPERLYVNIEKIINKY